MCVPINLRFSAVLRLLEPPFFTSAAFHQLKLKVPYFSPEEQAHTHTHEYKYTLSRWAWLGLSAPRQLLRPEKRKRFDPSRSHGRADCVWFSVVFQEVLAGFISLLTSPRQHQLLCRMGNSAWLFIFLCILTDLFVQFINARVPLYSYLVSWHDEANARDLIMSC